MEIRKRGTFFTFDSIIATILLMVAVAIISTYFIIEERTDQAEYLSFDSLNFLSDITMSNLNESEISYYMNESNITYLDNTVLEQIGFYWVKNQTNLSMNLTQTLMDKYIPKQYGYSVRVGGEEIYSRGIAKPMTSVVSTKQMVSGIEKFKPLRGSTGKVFLTGIGGKFISSYLYFGGFVGQGNVSRFIDELPSDANVTHMYMELDTQQNFSLYINGVKCGDFISSLSNMTSDGWDITSCADDINPGEGIKNYFTFYFNSTRLDNAYIGGGYIRIGYRTSKLGKTEVENYTRFTMPEIIGIINLYSTFYVPGSIDSMSVTLHYFANNTINDSINNTFYLKIGNVTVYADQNSTLKNVYLSNDSLGAVLDYSTMSQKNIPIRLGFENLSYSSVFEGNADVALITDESGSMDWNMTTDSTWGSPRRNCDDAMIDDLSTRRLSVAKCLDKQFAGDIINITGNQVGLISYSDFTNVGDTVNPTVDLVLLNNSIGTEVPQTGYTAGGSTCICCGINSARNMLVADLQDTVYIDSGDVWNYDVTNFFSAPPPDGEGDLWYELDYDDSGWPSGPAILGTDNGYTYNPAIVTDIGGNLDDSNLYYLDLWEHSNDNAGPPNDFSSNLLNQTANTYGIGLGDDGWDTASGTYNFGGAVTFDMYSTRIRINAPDNNQDVSGSYGLEVTVNQTVVDAITAGGTAEISFDYWWTETGDFEWWEDEVWVKGTWVSPTSGVHYLGDNYDSGWDGTYEIDAVYDPDDDIVNQPFSQSIGQWIEAPGTYYLTLGGKLERDSTNEEGYWTFDNIQILVTEPGPGIIYANLWEDAADNRGPPNDFSSGILNSTANTFGLGAGDDGWDDQSGVFDFANPVSFDDIVSGRLRISSQDNPNDVSGAYGIEIAITAAMYDLLTTNGEALLSFNWWWDDRGTFESSDHLWVKGTWVSPTTGTHYLGDDLDDKMDQYDATAEIYTDEDPDGDTGQRYFSQKIGSWIEGPGQYYLTFGGKLERDNWDEDGRWEFDNIQLKFTNLTNHYYFRRSFNVASAEDAQRGALSILSDDNALVYLNGVLLDEDYGTHDAKYWNVNGKRVSADDFQVGNNVVAVEMTNVEAAAKFDLKLVGFNTTRDKAMMVMTDGMANVGCGEQGVTPDMDGDGASDTDSDDAVKAACDARADYGIQVYAVGFSDNSDELALAAMAECGGGTYTTSDNSTELREFYKDVAYSIVTASRRSQVIEIEINGTNSRLYDDSFIEINYTPSFIPETFGKIFLNYESDQFNACSSSVNIPDELQVTEAALKSYSSEHWTDNVTIGGANVYSLAVYGSSYALLGDPFKIDIPPTMVVPGTNTLTVNTGDDPVTSFNCSPNNTMIYGGYADMQFTFEDVMEIAEGCDWQIEYEGSSFVNLTIPDYYAGGRDCNYTNASVEYNPSDIYDVMIYSLLDKLDLDDDRRLDINLNQSMLNINILEINEVPYMWGPTMVEVQVWQ